MSTQKPKKDYKQKRRQYDFVGPEIPTMLLKLRRSTQVIDELVSDLRDVPLPPLGAQFGTLEGEILADALVVHRIRSKYEMQDITKDKTRAYRSIQKMVQYDKGTGFRSFDYRNLSRDDRAIFLGAQAWLKRVLRTYRLPSVASRFPSGESVVSTDGLVGFADKLGLDSQWTCNIGSLDYAADLAYNTASLKRVVRDRFNSLYDSRVMRKGWGDTSNGRATFRRMFKAVVDIEPARITTVPKNAVDDRVISMEPTWAMVCQLQCSSALRECLLKEGIDITHQAVLNGAACALRAQATIDFRNASNSNWLKPIEQMWPRRVVKDLKRFRSEHFIVPGEQGDSYEMFNMLSPMGNGFTFEVMTMTILAIARQFDETAFVFGDDLIVNRSVAGPVTTFMKKLGWVVNDDKTFVDGNFRESCGSFWDVRTQTRLVSFDFTRPRHLYDVTVLANKLCCILVADQVCAYIRHKLLVAYTEICTVMGESFLVPMIAFSPRHDNRLGRPLKEGEIPVSSLREQLGIGMIYSPLVTHKSPPVGFYDTYDSPDERVTPRGLFESQYHRTVNYGTRIFLVPDKVERRYSGTVRYAAMLKEGTLPSDSVKHTRVSYVTIDKFTMVHSSRMPLLSVL